MSFPMSSAVLSTTVMIGLLSAGISNHIAQTGDVFWPDVFDGTAQSLYEAGFEEANVFNAAAVTAIGAVKYAVFGQASDGAIVGKDGWLFTTEELETTPEFEANIAASAEYISAVVDELGKEGIQVLPVLVPDKAEIYADQLGAERPGRVDARRAMFETFLTKNDVVFVDGYSILSAAKAKGAVFMKDDTHWSPYGSQRIALGVADHLRPVALTRVEVTTSTGEVTPFDGDLLRFVPTGGLRPYVGPAQHEITSFITEVANAGGLFDAPNVEVALVGTSFSALPTWHFEGFLKQALQADVINFAKEGKGPFAPMDAFLASDFLKTTPPKIVIWEIPVRYVSKDL